MPLDQCSQLGWWRNRRPTSGISSSSSSAAAAVVAAACAMPHGVSELSLSGTHVSVTIVFLIISQAVKLSSNLSRCLPLLLCPSILRVVTRCSIAFRWWKLGKFIWEQCEKTSYCINCRKDQIWSTWNQKLGHFISCCCYNSAMWRNLA